MQSLKMFYFSAVPDFLLCIQSSHLFVLQLSRAQQVHYYTNISTEQASALAACGSTLSSKWMMCWNLASIIFVLGSFEASTFSEAWLTNIPPSYP